jgi:hypothetical protein
MAEKKKERIVAPTKKALSDASKQLRKAHPSAGRAMADESVAKKQGIKPRK